MTFQELLTLLMPQTEVGFVIPKNDKQDLMWRIDAFKGDTIQGWSKAELKQLFRDNYYNLEAQIPCRHCGGKKDRRAFMPSKETVLKPRQ